jgi:hypothetical protein
VWILSAVLKAFGAADISAILESVVLGMNYF